VAEPVLRTSVEEIPGFETLLCPVCGFYYVHPLRVKVATGEFTVIVDAGGFRFLGAESEDSRVAVRNGGVRICLEYWCEYGHHGELILQFHEGVTTVEHRGLPPTAEARVIWRS